MYRFAANEIKSSTVLPQKRIKHFHKMSTIGPQTQAFLNHAIGEQNFLEVSIQVSSPAETTECLYCVPNTKFGLGFRMYGTIDMF